MASSRVGSDRIECPRAGSRGDAGATFEGSVVQGIRDLTQWLERDRLDMVARAKAMMTIIRDEEAAAKEEEREWRMERGEEPERPASGRAGARSRRPVRPW